MNLNETKNQKNQSTAQNQNNQNSASNRSNSNAKNSTGEKNGKSTKDSRTSGGVSKLPAGTPSSSFENEGYGVRSTTDPAVPNRAHTEI